MDIKISMVMLKCAVDLAWLSPTHRCLRPGCNPVNGGSIQQHLAPRHQGTKAHAIPQLCLAANNCDLFKSVPHPQHEMTLTSEY